MTDSRQLVSVAHGLERAFRDQLGRQTSRSLEEQGDPEPLAVVSPHLRQDADNSPRLRRDWVTHVLTVGSS
jgi:hypothetical protein